MTKPEAAQLLDLIIERAQGLRMAGVASVDLDGFKFGLLPYEPEVPRDFGDAAPEDKPKGALHDPDTFGRRSVPGNQTREPRQ